MQARPRTQPLRPAFLGILVCACIAAAALWYFFVRDTVVLETGTVAVEQKVDLALLRSSAFQQLVLPRGFPIEASIRFGRPNPFAALAPLATSTPTEMTLVAPTVPLEIVPLLPVPEAATTTPFSL